MKDFRIWERYQQNESVNVPAGTTVELLRYVIPSGVSLHIIDFANYVKNVSAWGNLAWSLSRNGIPVRGFHAILDQVGSQATPRLVAVPKFNGGDVLTVSVTNSAGVDYEAGCTFTGELRGEA